MREPCPAWKIDFAACACRTPNGGEDDSKFIAINQRMHLMLPSSYLSIIKGAGHRVHWDAPKTWLKEIELFISQL